MGQCVANSVRLGCHSRYTGSFTFSAHSIRCMYDIDIRLAFLKAHRALKSLELLCLARFAQTSRGVFRCDVALRSAEQFVTHHEFSYYR